MINLITAKSLAVLNFLSQTNADKPNFKLLGLISLFGLSWCFTAFRVSKIMEKTGRSRWRWFFICLVASAIPAVLIMWISRYNSGEYMNDRISKKFKHKTKNTGKGTLSANGTTCPHCGERIPDNYAKLDQCVYCKMKLNKDNIA